MQRLILWVLFCPALARAQDLATPYEKSFQTETATWQECIGWYELLAANYSSSVRLLEVGTADVGKPLHLVVISKDGIAGPGDPRMADRTVLLINNGIHPGEPDGVDASMLLARDLAQGKRPEWLENTVVLIIPLLNVDGALNRGPYSRANQNGPLQYGFRGNRRNLDLNRDFVKQDSRNVQALVRVFRDWRPHVFLDNHTTNGADYQPTMTLLTTLEAKLHSAQATFFRDTLLAGLYRDHAEVGTPLVPYVNPVASIPDSGLVAFYDTPRYSTGFAALNHCLGLVAETHMLKPFPARVDATQLLMHLILAHMALHGERIRSLRKEAETVRPAVRPLAWKLDTTQRDSIRFYGYTARYRPSTVHGHDRLYYDRTSPWVRTIPFYRAYLPHDSVRVPRAYIIPQAWHEVVERLQNAGVQFDTLRRDTLLLATFYRIDEYATWPRPFEGHIGHSAGRLTSTQTQADFYAGDLIAPTDQPQGRLLVELLEPQGVDSYFAWGFFDSILQQKEYFSDYVWEDRAAELLANDLALREAFAQARAQDPELARNPHAQLLWLYDHSPHKEPTAYRYPIGRWE